MELVFRVIILQKTVTSVTCEINIVLEVYAAPVYSVNFIFFFPIPELYSQTKVDELCKILVLRLGG